MIPPLDSVPMLITAISNAVAEIGEQPEDVAVEGMAIQVYSAMCGNARLFHTIKHAMQLSEGQDPTQVLAALYHDVVYIPVDGGFPIRLKTALARFVPGLKSGRVARPPAPGSCLWAEMTYAVFGVTHEEHFTAGAGRNEFLSALAAASALHPYLSPQVLLGVVACIEGTIPFRPNIDPSSSWTGALYTRLQACNTRFALGMSDDALHTVVQQAVHLANRDVHSFGATEPGTFLDNTWMLLAEGKPILRQPGLYNIREYREGLTQMSRFLANLDPTRVFTAYYGAPSPTELATLHHRAHTNISLAVRYLNTKIYTVGIIEAAARITGGDLPLSLLMGGLPDVDQSVERLAESLAPLALKPCDDVDFELSALFERGHAHANDFDLKRSPVSALIYHHLGEAGIKRSVEASEVFFSGDEEPSAFFDAQPIGVRRVVLTLLSRVAVVRKKTFQALLDGL